MNKAVITYITIIFNLISCSTSHLANNEEEFPNDNSELVSHEEIFVPADIIYSWKLEALRVEANESFMKIINNNKTPTLKINKNGHVEGYDGCNGYSSKIIFINSSNYRFSGFLSTSRGCHPSVYWHDKFYKAISTANNYNIQSGKLLLKRDSHVLMTFFKINE